MASNPELGKTGEEISKEYLSAKGYTILERNWRYGNDEIDLIAICRGELVIVEVKTRASALLGEPFMAVNRQKQRFLIRAANAYVVNKNIQMDVRFDIVSIVVDKDGPKIEHLENAFYPTL